MEQVDRLFRLLNLKLHGVIALTVDFAALIRRITARRTCAACGEIINLLVSSLPPGAGCPKCGGPFIQRDDDNEFTVRTRLENYRFETEPLLNHYDSIGLLHRVDGQGSVDEVGARVAQVVQSIEEFVTQGDSE